MFLHFLRNIACGMRGIIYLTSLTAVAYECEQEGFSLTDYLTHVSAQAHSSNTLGNNYFYILEKPNYKAGSYRETLPLFGQAVDMQNETGICDFTFTQSSDGIQQNNSNIPFFNYTQMPAECVAAYLQRVEPFQQVIFYGAAPIHTACVPHNQEWQWTPLHIPQALQAQTLDDIFNHNEKLVIFNNTALYEEHYFYTKPLANDRSKSLALISNALLPAETDHHLGAIAAYLSPSSTASEYFSLYRDGLGTINIDENLWTNEKAPRPYLEFPIADFNHIQFKQHSAIEKSLTLHNPTDTVKRYRIDTHAIKLPVGLRLWVVPEVTVMPHSSATIAMSLYTTKEPFSAALSTNMAKQPWLKGFVQLRDSNDSDHGNNLFFALAGYFKPTAEVQEIPLYGQEYLLLNLSNYAFSYQQFLKATPDASSTTTLGVAAQSDHSLLLGIQTKGEVLTPMDYSLEIYFDLDGDGNNDVSVYAADENAIRWAGKQLQTRPSTQPPAGRWNVAVNDLPFQLQKDSQIQNILQQFDATVAAFAKNTTALTVEHFKYNPQHALLAVQKYLNQQVKNGALSSAASQEHLNILYQLVNQYAAREKTIHAKIIDASENNIVDVDYFAQSWTLPLTGAWIQAISDNTRVHYQRKKIQELPIQTLEKASFRINTAQGLHTLPKAEAQPLSAYGTQQVSTSPWRKDELFTLFGR